MKENKKNVIFIGVIVLLVVVVIILGISLVNEKNKNADSHSQQTQKNEQITTLVEQTTADAGLDTTKATEGIADTETTNQQETQTTVSTENLVEADASAADVIETLIAKELVAHTSGDVLVAVADTEREMYSYHTVNEILRNANVDHGWNTFEQNVKGMLGGLATESDGITTISPKQEGMVFWVHITGTFEAGYQVRVQVAAEDPFATERVVYDDTVIHVYYERKDLMYDSETCSLAFWNEADKSIKYYFFDENGRIDITVPEGMEQAGFFVKDVQGSRTSSASGNGGIIKFVDDTPVTVGGKKGNTLNIHIEEGVYVDDGTTVSQEWFLNE